MHKGLSSDIPWQKNTCDFGEIATAAILFPMVRFLHKISGKSYPYCIQIVLDILKDFDYIDEELASNNKMLAI